MVHNQHIAYAVIYVRTARTAPRLEKKKCYKLKLLHVGLLFGDPVLGDPVLGEPALHGGAKCSAIQYLGCQ